MFRKTSHRPYRRNFLKQAGLLSGATLMSSSVLAGTLLSEVKEDIDLPTDLVILFQGDSITDAGRRRDLYYPNNGGGMGTGYVYLIVAHLLGSHPGKGLRHYNRGISGNKVFELAARWEDDCLHLQPDVLSILIGVNDFWHTLSHGYPGTVEVYEQDLRRLLDRTLKPLPKLKLIFGEPFAVKGGSAITANWFPAFNGYREAARRIATDYQAEFIPYQTIFDQALEKAPVEFWCPDGVHPSIAGCQLMADAWLKAFTEVMK